MTPRLPLVTDPSEEVRQTLEKTLVRGGAPLNVFRMLAHNPRILKRFNVLGGAYLTKGALPPRVREIVVLRTAWNARCAYELGQHTLIARDAGLRDEEIASIASAAPRLPGDEALLIALADELFADDRVSDATWAALAERWAPSELVELVTMVGFYRMLAGFLNTFDVPLEDDVVRSTKRLAPTEE